MSTAQREIEFCESNMIAAYIDGELESSDSLLFERHLDDCDSCRNEVRAHKSFICELDAALTQKMDVAMPLDFSRTVAARATSDMSGVRSFAEHSKALVICVVLAVMSFAFLGGAAGASGLVIVRKLGGRFFGVASFMGAAFYDMIASVMVITRVVTTRFIVESRSFGVLLVLLAFAIFLLSRLISRYHRLGEIK